MKSTKYYVSSKSGKDSNDGLTPDSPFVSLDKINAVQLEAGDSVFLERGSVFENQYLHIKNAGDINEKAIEITAYGEGALPRINANGTGVWYQDYGQPLDFKGHIYKGDVSSAIFLYDTENIVISDIEVTNYEPFTTLDEYSRANKMDRTGVAVVAQNRGTLHNIVLDKLVVHDISGNVYNKHMNNGGIYMTSFKPDDEAKTGIPRYDGVRVTNCHVQNVSRWGIAVGYTYLHDKFSSRALPDELFYKYGNENIYIANNYVKNAGGDAITPMYALRPIVEHNLSESIACEMNDRYYRFPEKRMGKVAAAIWPWKCKDALLRYNEATDTKLNQDGMAYDADSGDGTVYEYNYSRLNEGGCIMFCLQQAYRNTFRNNLSYDDLGGTISPCSNPDALIENNKFYVRKGVPFKRKRMRNGKITLRNNEINIID